MAVDEADPFQKASSQEDGGAESSPGDGRGTDLRPEHWTDLDVESLWPLKGNRGAGRGWSGEVRKGFLKISRTGLDDLMALVRTGHLELHDVTIVLWLLSAAAYRDDHPGMVLDTVKGLATRAGVRRDRFASSASRAVALGIVHRLYRRTASGSDSPAGYRFPSESYFWLTSGDGAAAPWPVQDALAEGAPPPVGDGEEPYDGPTEEDIFGPN